MSSTQRAYIPVYSGRKYCDPKVGPVFTDLDQAFAYFGFPQEEYVHSSEIVKFGTLEHWLGYKRRLWVRTDEERNYWIHEREVGEWERGNLT